LRGGGWNIIPIPPLKVVIRRKEEGNRD